MGLEVEPQQDQTFADFTDQGLHVLWELFPSHDVYLLIRCD
ncbi:MAG TPA: hypothetical protein PKW05_11345 [Anaerolineae bacterium]|nr:hypothetical protein [Anaerolineae bacterium]